MSCRRRVLLALLGLPLCGVLVAGLVASAWLALGQPLPAEGQTWLTVQDVSGSSASFSGSPAEPRFFLVVGSDAREGGPGGSRGDAVHVVGVNPALGATILNIPRDTAVPIPGSGTDKINAALQHGGLELMARTVSGVVGIDIPVAVVTDFDGFVGLVDEIGGIDVNLPQALDDPDSGAFLPAGPQHIDGGQALAIARDRKDFPSGDVARTENQAMLMISALATLRNNADIQNFTASHTLRLLAVLSRHTELRGVGLVDLYRLGRLALSLDPAAIRNVTIPTGGGTGSNLSMGPGADSLLQDFRDDGVLQTH